MCERDAQDLELHALQGATETGMARLQALRDQIRASSDPTAIEKLSREYVRVHTTVLKSIEAAHRIKLRQRRRTAARPPVPREIDGSTVH